MNTRSLRSEQGFTLIELLVVILIIGILAAIAIPSFLSQRSKATDSSAKELARTAQTTAETYATDHSGSFTGLSVTELNKYEATIQTKAGNNNAWLEKAEATESGAGFKVTAASATANHSFSITKKSNGELERSCTPTGKVGAEGGGCQNSTW
jgi:type IV pilus assembly protein PilA